MRVCSVPGCPIIYDGTKTRCPAHEATANAQHWAKTRAYSTKEHRSFRAAVLESDKTCVLCRQAPATRADHYPRERSQLIELGLNPNDPQFGRGLCESCHNKHTATSHPAGWNARA